MARQIVFKRWTVEQAAAEFDASRETIHDAIKKQGILPGTDNQFSTMQICKAVYGDIDAAILERTRNQAKVLSIEIAQSEGRLIPVDEWIPVINNALTAMKRCIESAANLEKADKNKIIKELQDLWIVAHGATPGDGPDAEPASNPKSL